MFLRRQHVKPQTFELAHQLRLNPTRSEDALWQVLRKKRLGVRFHRQKVISGYIADFWCPAWKLVVELDGAGHDLFHDKKRDASLAAMGIRTIRFPNHFPPNQVAQIIAQWAKENQCRPEPCQTVTAVTISPRKKKKPRLVQPLTDHEKMAAEVEAERNRPSPYFRIDKI